MQFFLQMWFHLRGNKKALQQYNIYYQVAFLQQIISPTQIRLFLVGLVCRFVERNVKTYEATYRFTHITHTSFSRQCNMLGYFNRLLSKVRNIQREILTSISSIAPRPFVV